VALKFLKNLFKKKKKVEAVNYSPTFNSSGQQTQISGMRINMLIIIVGGTALLLAAIMFYLLIMQGVFGKFDIEEFAPSPKNIKDAVEQKTEIAILYSRYTENLLPEGNTWLSDNVSTWESFLKSHNFKYDILDDYQIELGEHYKYKLLILPGSKALSNKEVANLKKYIKAGGSVFSTTGIATFSPDGKWDGWKLFNEVFGLKFTKEIDPNAEGVKKIHTVRGNLPITAGVPTGYTLNIATWDRPIYAEVLEPRTEQASYWYDFRHERGLVLENIRKSAGIAFGTYGTGRFVWYGFELNSVIGTQEDYIYFDRLFASSMRWLLYQPTLQIVDWPPPYQSAAVIVPTIGENAENYRNFASSGLNEYTSTIFIDSYELGNNQSILKNIARTKDIGLIADIGRLDSFADTTNSLFQLNEQVDVLKNSRNNLESTVGVFPVKFSPVNGYFNQNTLLAMAKNQYNMIFTDSLTNRLVPKTEIYDKKPIVIVGNTSRDDYVILNEFGLTDLDFQEYTYNEDIDRIDFTGGLYVLKIHTDGQLKPENAPVLNRIKNYIVEKERMWLTSLDEIQNWWIEKGAIEVHYETRSKRRISVEITNPTDKAIRNVLVKVFLNKPVYDLKLSSDIINTKIPNHNYDENSQVLYLNFDVLKAGDTRSLLIDFENTNEKK